MKIERKLIIVLKSKWKHQCKSMDNNLFQHYFMQGLNCKQ